MDIPPSLTPPMTLPVHRSLPSDADFTSSLSKWSSFVRKNLNVRWLSFACVVIVVIWFGDLWSHGLGRSERFLHPWDTTTVASHLHRPLTVPPPPTRVLPILPTSYYRYLGVDLTSFFFPLFLTFRSTDIIFL